MKYGLYKELVSEDQGDGYIVNSENITHVWETICDGLPVTYFCTKTGRYWNGNDDGEAVIRNKPIANCSTLVGRTYEDWRLKEKTNNSVILESGWMQPLQEVAEGETPWNN